MKNALIDPTAAGITMSGWNPPVPPETRYTPIVEIIADAARVAEVADAEFPITPPLFWTPCADDVVADQWYYDTVSQQIIQIPAIPPYPGTEGSTTGVQSV